ncbi:MAG: sensor histidine kinase [Actinomycetota bacterium]
MAEIIAGAPLKSAEDEVQTLDIGASRPPHITALRRISFLAETTLEVLRLDSFASPPEARPSYFPGSTPSREEIVIPRRPAGSAQLCPADPQLSSWVVAARDEERRRLGRDLHDGLQQDLVVLRMRLGLLGEGAGDDREAEEARRQLAEEVDQIIQRLRELAHTVFPPTLIDRGLTAALGSHLTKIPVLTKLASDPDPLPRLVPEIESSAYFVALEAVTNALKHAEASRLEVSMRLAAGVLEVRVTDDGRGFEIRDLRERRGGGMGNMSERVHALGGVLGVRSEPGFGTVIRAQFPAKEADR